MIKLNTIDFDDRAFSQLKPVLEFISNCPNCVSLKYRDSASMNGYHVRMLCNIDCDYCREKFDDWRRFFWDKFAKNSNRSRNVLWDSKSFSKGFNKIRLYAGSWKVVK